MKLFLLVEAIIFSASTFSSGELIAELLNINDSVRLLKIANLSCIHIPVEVFQSSETYLGPCQTSGMMRFCGNC